MPGSRRWFGSAGVALAVAVLATLLSGQAGDERVNIDPRPKAPKKEPELKRRESTFRIDVPMVLVPVTVTDPMGRLVTALEKEHFKLFEEKVEQKILHFGAEDAPLSVGIIFDTSGSMGHKLSKSRQAVAQFFKTANPQDECFLVQFNDSPELSVDFTKDLEQVQNRLTFTQAKGRTALLDAIYMGLNNMKRAQHAKRALLVISDGGYNSSRYTEREIRKLVREADVQIYAIGIYEPVSSRGRTSEELSGPSLLSEVAEQTGGRQFPVDNLNELPDVAAKIGLELRNQYVLGYTPTNQAKDGKWRRIQVRLVQPKGMPQLRAFAKLGYYAPAQ